MNLEESSRETLRVLNVASTVGDMNAHLAQDVVSNIRRRHQGKLVHFAKRVQPDVEARVRAAARLWAVSESDAVRIALEMSLPPADDE